MYNVIKNVINAKNYELSDILNKINTMWIGGNLTDEQRMELVEIARTNATPENSYVGTQRQIADIWDKLKEQDAEIQSLKSMLSATPEEPAPEVEEYPEYINPTGAHDAYHAGDKVTYNGIRYICIAPEGVAVVWSPDVYPAYWEEVTETSDKISEGTPE